MDKIPSMRCPLCNTTDLEIPKFHEHLKSDDHKANLLSALRQTVNNTLVRYKLDSLSLPTANVPILSNSHICLWCAAGIAEESESRTILVSDLDAGPFLKAFGLNEATVHEVCHEIFIAEIGTMPKLPRPRLEAGVWIIPPSPDLTEGTQANVYNARFPITDGSPTLSIDSVQAEARFNINALPDNMILSTEEIVAIQAMIGTLRDLNGTTTEPKKGIRAHLKRKVLKWIFF